MVVHRSVCRHLVLDQLTLLQLNAELAVELTFMAETHVGAELHGSAPATSGLGPR